MSEAWRGLGLRELLPAPRDAATTSLGRSRWGRRTSGRGGVPGGQSVLGERGTQLSSHGNWSRQQPACTRKPPPLCWSSSWRRRQPTDTWTSALGHRVQGPQLCVPSFARHNRELTIGDSLHGGGRRGVTNSVVTHYTAKKTNMRIQPRVHRWYKKDHVCFP